MIVVSDTSCITSLIQIGEINLLAEIFGEVVIPPTVETELKQFHSSLPVFLLVRQPSHSEEIKLLLAKLDKGEAEAIALASELKADYLLMDEAAGRSEALKMKLRLIGTLAVLVAAKEKGLIKEVGNLMLRLEKEAGFRISRHVKNEALLAAGEIE